MYERVVVFLKACSLIYTNAENAHSKIYSEVVKTIFWGQCTLRNTNSLARTKWDKNKRINDYRKKQISQKSMVSAFG